MTCIMKKYLTIALSISMVFGLCACGSESTSTPQNVDVFSKGFVSELSEQPVPDADSSRTIGDAVNDLFVDPSWGTDGGDTDNQREATVSGKDAEENFWVITFTCGADSTSDWQAELVQYHPANGIPNYADEYGSDLLMTYFLTGNARYKEAYDQVYSCYNPKEKSYKIETIFENLVDDYKYSLKDLTEKSSNVNVFFDYDEDAAQFIKKYNRLFPNEYAVIPGELINLEADANLLRRNINRYSSQIIPIHNLTVSLIHEETVGPNEYCTEIVAWDYDGNCYDIYYCDEITWLTEWVDISVLALPVGTARIETNQGNEDRIVLLACSLNECFSFDGNLSWIVSAEDRYDAAVRYATGEYTGSLDEIFISEIENPFEGDFNNNEPSTDNGSASNYVDESELNGTFGSVDSMPPSYLEITIPEYETLIMGSYSLHVPRSGYEVTGIITRISESSFKLIPDDTGEMAQLDVTGYSNGVTQLYYYEPDTGFGCYYE